MPKLMSRGKLERWYWHVYTQTMLLLLYEDDYDGDGDEDGDDVSDYGDSKYRHYVHI